MVSQLSPIKQNHQLVILSFRLIALFKFKLNDRMVNCDSRSEGTFNGEVPLRFYKTASCNLKVSQSRARYVDTMSHVGVFACECIRVFFERTWVQRTRCEIARLRNPGPTFFTVIDDPDVPVYNCSLKLIPKSDGYEKGGKLRTHSQKRSATRDRSVALKPASNKVVIRKRMIREN